ncbi:TraB/GumN family protein [Novosphingobium sp. FGD1]|uniref:TraB/GumN family protein n=1 Tax=Novosphingobium silvae TaxID=2692619 RepID=A0A7X4GGC9_9SPHN|nr:TraB/GumN family protein [Novosphingobium silvae]
MPAALLLAAVLFACSPQSHEADPALWRVVDREGHVGWLFGTIHSSDRPVNWRTPAVAAAFERSGTVMVEVANLADEREVAATFAELARSEGEPPLSLRVAPQDRPAVEKLLKKSGHADHDFAEMDTWAAALTIARAGAEGEDTRYGVDRAVIAAAGARPVLELEGAARQLGLFDSLPEREQRDLLAAVVKEAAAPDRGLAKSWRSGDMTAIEKETRAGLLADPELRQVLFTGRNLRWTGLIARQIRSGKRPFVAVGAAHMAGPDGLPAMLAARGFRVVRVE